MSNSTSYTVLRGEFEVISSFVGFSSLCSWQVELGSGEDKDLRRVSNQLFCFFFAPTSLTLFFKGRNKDDRTGKV